jgi:hypothetical protein
VGTGVGRTGTGMADRREQLCLLDPRLPGSSCACWIQDYLQMHRKDKCLLCFSIKVLHGAIASLCDFPKYPRSLFRDWASTRVGAAAEAADSAVAAAAAADSIIRIGNAD